MSMDHRIGCQQQSRLPYLVYRGEQTLVAPANVALTIPGQTSVIELGVEDEPLYFCVGGGGANALSGGYVPADAVLLLPPIAAATLAAGIRVLSAGTVHVIYWWEGSYS